MKIKVLNADFSICKVTALPKDIDGLVFFAKTDEENSLVCETRYVPADAAVCDDGWKGFRIEGTLDFSIIGILAKITTKLADEKIGVFVVSTYNTDYVFVKSECLERALTALTAIGYEVFR